MNALIQITGTDLAITKEITNKVISTTILTFHMAKGVGSGIIITVAKTIGIGKITAIITIIGITTKKIANAKIQEKNIIATKITKTKNAIALGADLNVSLVADKKWGNKPHLIIKKRGFHPVLCS